MMTSDFKVLIVGGSVAGLSLAHCLKRLGVSFTILEQGNEIAPQLGASIGILPNGGRILDQLGIFADVEREIEPLEIARIRYPDGFWFESRYPQALQSKYAFVTQGVKVLARMMLIVIYDSYGYPVSFLERQKFLDILHKTLGSDDCIHTNKKVVAVENAQDTAVVRTLDGAEYAADLVVAADGVHSVVRSEIWRHLTETAQVSATDDPNEGMVL
jgi:FAD dependent monooxygenase